MRTPLAERKLHRRAIVSTQSEDLFVYEVHGEQIFADDNGCLSYDTAKKDPVVDESTASVVLAQMMQDGRVVSARRKLAQKQAGGSGLLARVLGWHLEFTSGHMQPCPEGDLTFFQVGRNASHEFFVAIDDGQPHVMSICCDWDEEKQEAVIEKRIRKVNTLSACYLGHL